jgi:DHA1 family multidrug resistance protein-like MFS transporter
MKRVEVERIKVDYFSFSTIKKNWNIYLSFFLRHIGAVAIWTIFPLYLFTLGADTFWIGVIYTINPIVQFFMMRRLDSFNMEKVVKAGHFFSVAAFFSLIPATVFYHVIPSMLMVAASWSFLLVGSTELLIKRNKDKATASGFLNSVISLSMIIGALLGGAVANQWGFQAVFVVAGGLSLVSLMVSTTLTQPQV